MNTKIKFDFFFKFLLRFCVFFKRKPEEKEGGGRRGKGKHNGRFSTKRKKIQKLYYFQINDNGYLKKEKKKTKPD